MSAARTAAHRGVRAAIKVLVTAGAMTWVAWHVQWRDDVSAHGGDRPGILSIIARADPAWVVLFFACVTCSAVLMIGRWQALLSASRLSAPLPWAATVWARSQVVTLLPTSEVGGDLYRLSHARLRFGTAIAPMGAILFERLTGLLALLCLAGCAVTVSPARAHLGLTAATTQSMVIAGGICLLTLLALSGTRVRAFVQHALFQRPALARWWPGQLPHRRAVALSLVLSLLIHGLSACSFWVVDRALLLGTPPWCYFIAIPLTNIACYLPIHVAGVGIVEGGLWLLLSRWTALSATEVLAVAGTARVLNLAWRGILASSFLWPLPDPRASAVPSPSACGVTDLPPDMAEPTPLRHPPPVEPIRPAASIGR